MKSKPTSEFHSLRLIDNGSQCRMLVAIAHYRRSATVSVAIGDTVSVVVMMSVVVVQSVVVMHVVQIAIASLLCRMMMLVMMIVAVGKAIVVVFVLLVEFRSDRTNRVLVLLRVVSGSQNLLLLDAVPARSVRAV